MGLPEEILYESNFQNAAKYYFMYTKLDFIWTLNLFALVVLNFLEVSCRFYLGYVIVIST